MHDLPESQATFLTSYEPIQQHMVVLLAPQSACTLG
jgi:hypothetical protein